MKSEDIDNRFKHGGPGTFTDDDLKQLKERQANESGMDFEWFEIDNDVLEALLARLEAAEKAMYELRGFYVCRTHGCPNDGMDRATECDHDKRSLVPFEAWRKACGK